MEIKLRTTECKEVKKILSLYGWEFEIRGSVFCIPLYEGADEESAMECLEEILDGISFIFE